MGANNHSGADPFEAQDPQRLPLIHHPDSQTNAQFELACYTNKQLFLKRNKEYAGAFKKYGLLGVIFEILGILNRLPPMTIWKTHGERMNSKKLHDLFMDLHNYSNMALICLEDNNWDGLHPIVEGETDANSST
jgi:hypothetical protein